MTTADFYVGLGEHAEWLGSVALDGSTGDMDDAGLFGPPEDGGLYDEGVFRSIVDQILDTASRNDKGYRAADGDPWPWPYPDSGGTDRVYAFTRGSIHVFEKGENDSGETGGFLVAIHYANGARKPSKWPQLGA